MFDLVTPAFEFLLNRIVPLDDRHRVGIVVRIQQFEAGATIEPAIEADGLDLGIRAVEESRELPEDIAGGSPVTSWRTTSVLICHVRVRRASA